MICSHVAHLQQAPQPSPPTLSTICWSASAAADCASRRVPSHGLSTQLCAAARLITSHTRARLYGDAVAMVQPPQDTVTSIARVRARSRYLGPNLNKGEG